VAFKVRPFAAINLKPIEEVFLFGCRTVFCLTLIHDLSETFQEKILVAVYAVRDKHSGLQRLV